MKKSLSLLLFFVLCANSSAQDFSGTWNGVLLLPNSQLRLVFNLTKPDSYYTATMDSPDQGVKGFMVDTVIVKGDSLYLIISKIQAEYRGIKVSSDSISGILIQRGTTFPLGLKNGQLEAPRRPQEPKPKHPYAIENIDFQNQKANIKLSGTLNKPLGNKKFPAVILISGSGPQNRDEEIMEHKPFLVISDYLTQKGIAVLRYDDRGVGHSEGNFSHATTEDFATDAQAAINYLRSRKDIDHKKIGIIGHSEGGTITFMIAAQNNPSVNFIVSLAGTALQGDSILYKQNELAAKSMGVSDAIWQIQAKTLQEAYRIVIEAKDSEEAKISLTNYYSKMYSPQIAESSHVQQQISGLTNKWMKFFLGYNPAIDIAKVKCPVLALNGERDMQVGVENLQIIQQTLLNNGNKHTTVKVYPELNHLFQHCVTGMPDEYAQIEETFSYEVLKEIAEWILKTVNKR